MWELDPAAMAHDSTVKECCICGDVGFHDALLHCLSCGFRFQHTYCSSSYPKIDMATWRCEWCIHEESKKRSNNSFDFLLEIAKSLPDGGGGGGGGGEGEEEVQLQPPSSGNEEKRQRRRRDDDKQQRPKTKRQKSLDRWRRPNCNSSSSPRVIGQRYKLLADVLC